MIIHIETPHINNLAPDNTEDVSGEREQISLTLQHSSYTPSSSSLSASTVQTHNFPKKPEDDLTKMLRQSHQKLKTTSHIKLRQPHQCYTLFHSVIQWYTVLYSVIKCNTVLYMYNL